MVERKISIKEEYDQELLEIKNVLTELENSLVYELRGAGYGSLPHNAQKLRTMIFDLINKIDKEKPSDGDLDGSLLEKIRVS